MFNGRLRHYGVMDSGFPLLASSPLHGLDRAKRDDGGNSRTCRLQAVRLHLSGRSRRSYSEASLLLIPGIDAGVCGESSIRIREWGRPLRSGRPHPFRKIEWVESPRCPGNAGDRKGDGPLRFDALHGASQLCQQGHRSPVSVSDLQRSGQHDDARPGPLLCLIHRNDSLLS